MAVVVCQSKGHVLVFDVDPENGKLYEKQAKNKNIWLKLFTMKSILVRKLSINYILIYPLLIHLNFLKLRAIFYPQ